MEDSSFKLSLLTGDNWLATLRMGLMARGPEAGEEFFGLGETWMEANRCSNSIDKDFTMAFWGVEFKLVVVVKVLSVVIKRCDIPAFVGDCSLLSCSLASVAKFLARKSGCPSFRSRFGVLHRSATSGSVLRCSSAGRLMSEISSSTISCSFGGVVFVIAEAVNFIGEND